KWPCRSSAVLSKCRLISSTVSLSMTLSEIGTVPNPRARPQTKIRQEGRASTSAGESHGGTPVSPEGGRGGSERSRVIVSPTGHGELPHDRRCVPPIRRLGDRPSRRVPTAIRRHHPRALAPGPHGAPRHPHERPRG